MIWERSREWYEPDYYPDPDRTCPICKKDCETIYVFEGLELGCNECLTSLPEERWGECTSRVDGDYVYLKCPLCGKKLVTKTSKSRRTFYSCEDYPNCSFSCWDIPTDETCPKCGAMVLKKKYKNIRYCSKNCGWTSEGEKKSES